MCISDINEDALLFARINILKNGLQDRANVRRIDLQAGVRDTPDTASERFSVIAGSEILYLEQLHRPLITFLKCHLELPSSGAAAPEVLLTTDHRRNADAFFALAEKTFRVEHKTVGIKESAAPGIDTETHPDATRAERYLISLHRLSPLR